MLLHFFSVNSSLNCNIYQFFLRLYLLFFFCQVKNHVLLEILIKTIFLTFDILIFDNFLNNLEHCFVHDRTDTNSTIQLQIFYFLKKKKFLWCFDESKLWLHEIIFSGLVKKNQTGQSM